jgi:hypothetical protein
VSTNHRASLLKSLEIIRVDCKHVHPRLPLVNGLVSRAVMTSALAAVSLAGGLSACGESAAEHLLGRGEDAAVRLEASTDARPAREAGVLDARSGGSPQLEVRPPFRCLESFGVCKHLEIANVGGGPLAITRIELLDAFDNFESRHFELGGLLPVCRGLALCRLALTIEPTDSIEVDVCLRPDSGNPTRSAILRVISDDPVSEGPRRSAALTECGF